MFSLYGINGKKYLALLLLCQLGFFLTASLFIFLVFIKLEGLLDIPYSIMSLPLWVLYGISALWIGLFWEAFSKTIFSVYASTKLLFQQWFIVPTLVLFLIGTYTSHAILLTDQINNRLIVTFTPLFLAGILATLVTFIVTGIVFKQIRKDTEVNIQSQKKLAELRENFGAEAIKRMELSIDLAYGRAFANPLPPQQGLIIVGLTYKPWYEISVLPEANLLEDNYEIICQEALHTMNSKTLLRPFDYPGVNDGAWDSIELIESGKKVESSCLHFPKTVKFLEELSNYARLTSAALSVVKPGKVIKPHRDPANSSIICQLGLVIPEKCGIRVGGESRTWKEGKCVFFDPSYEHTVWNYSDTPRVVLLLVFLKPELTDIEMDFLQMLICGE